MTRLRLTLVAACAALLASALLVGQADALVSIPATPGGYIPTASRAEYDQPGIYFNGCHLTVAPIEPVACTHGQPRVASSVPAGTKTIALFGDSHAVHWFAGVQRVADQRGWRMLSVTKTHCPIEVLNVAVYLSASRYTQCSQWRSNAFKQFALGAWGEIDVLVIGSYSGHVLYTSRTGPRVLVPDRVVAYADGMRRALRALAPHVGRVVIMRDTPDLPGKRSSFNACMRANVTNANSCGGVARRALDWRIAGAEKRVAAEFPNVEVLDLTADLCPDGYCLTVFDGIRAYKDDNHLSQSFVYRVMSGRMRPTLNAAMDLATAPK
ncbi:MAG: hypothetical protein F2881_06530 [Actinobacteria bacterium]|uniref:Unannotated protein n=2 Tax=freshwater metagenome TaxID=449393 RepID=A0A6J7QCM9_9ZZZZ|nr:hypothetical protein [Actinomycetota bacterium]